MRRPGSVSGSASTPCRLNAQRRAKRRSLRAMAKRWPWTAVAHGTATALSTNSPTSVARLGRGVVARLESVADDAGQHGLHVFGHDTLMAMDQRPRLRGTQQTDRGARRNAGFEMRATRACSARSPARSRAAHRRRAPSAPSSASAAVAAATASATSVASRSRRSWPSSNSRSSAGSGIAQLDAHQEAVELRFGQRIGADLVRPDSAWR